MKTASLIATLSISLGSAAMSAAVQEGADRQSRQEISRARVEIETTFGDSTAILSATEPVNILGGYQYIDPKAEVPRSLLDKTLLFFDQNKTKFSNQAYITVIDLAPRSDKFRFFLINMTSGEVQKYRTTHGYGSDNNNDGYAEAFSNIVNSGSSSLGFIRTAEVYWGRFNRSLRLDGLSATNTKLRERTVVVHGWDYVSEKQVIQGLTWGCPALDWAIKDAVIDKIKDGSLMYIGLSQ